ncbi:hypothetical protein D6D01_05735 [Aureobasidium pullulans]|uniref:DNA-directed RNA polymerase III subunit RPC9 n=1 Tax=Aureobasidium pullulans TaxID=5580 RepID=A0A4V4JV40_AURPU|nr:hypothetical protein D6D01_05735 [Aureobasidium pullulans]
MTEEILVSSRSFGAAAVVLPTCTEGAVQDFIADEARLDNLEVDVEVISLNMKILDAGTEVLDDYDVLKFIRDKRAQIKEEKEQSKQEKRPNSYRPANLMKSLQKHEEHLTDKDRPFLDNPRYDNNSQYLNKLMQTLGPRVQLTKSEYLTIANQRPFRRSHIAAMIEDADTRFTMEEQNFIRDAVTDILGIPEKEEQNLDYTPVEVKG